MNTPESDDRKCHERSTFAAPSATKADSMFRLLFERSADAILLFEPSRELFVDCNDAALALLRAQTKDQLLMAHPADLSPEYQPDGKSSRTKTTEMIQAVLRQG